MKQGGDFFERTRREWLKRALLGGAAMPLLLRDALAADKRPSGMIEVHGEMPIKMIEQAPVVNHTDAEPTMLEALVGRKPPFVGSGLEYKY